jgi:hypothetical protein
VSTTTAPTTEEEMEQWKAFQISEDKSTGYEDEVQAMKAVIHGQITVSPPAHLASDFPGEFGQYNPS